jgi:hypothetical protein
MPAPVHRPDAWGTLATAYSGEGIKSGGAARLDLPNWRKAAATFVNFSGPLPRMTCDALDYIKRNFISETVIYVSR